MNGLTKLIVTITKKDLSLQPFIIVNLLNGE